MGRNTRCVTSDNCRLRHASRAPAARNEQSHIPTDECMRNLLHAAALVTTIAAASLASTASSLAQATRSGNPILPGWYADPEAHVFEGQYWIYPTYSAP